MSNTSASPNPSTSDSDMDARQSQQAEATLKCSSSILKKLFSLSSPYISSEEQLELGINCTTLNLELNKHPKGGPKFDSPFPLDTLDERLAATEPWLEYEPTFEEGQLNMSGALETAYALEHYLEWTGQKDDLDSLLSRTMWQTRDIFSNEYERGLWSERSGREWRTKLVMDMQDSNVPHIRCVVAEDAPLTDNCLNVSELRCVIGLTNSRVMAGEYEAHRIFPVTVVTASGRQARVFQGYIDNKDGKIHACKSEIIDLEKNMRKKMKLLLSWLLAKPKGDTLLEK